MVPRRDGALGRRGRDASAAGVVVIPADDLRPVLEEAAGIEDRDAETVARMRDEDRRGPGGAYQLWARRGRSRTMASGSKPTG
jgi:hypothetical protein